MSTFKSSLSSIKYHTLTRPAIKTIAKTAKRYVERFKDKHGSVVRKTHIKTRGELRHNERVLSKGTLAGKKRRVDLGQDLKDRMPSSARPKRKHQGSSYVPPGKAKKGGTAKILSSHVVSTGPTTSAPKQKATRTTKTRTSNYTPRPKKTKPLAHGADIFKKHSTIKRVGKVSEAVGSSKTHGELKAKLRNQSVRLVTAHQKRAGATRRAIAQAIRAGRKKVGSAYLKQNIRDVHNVRMHEAAKQLARLKKK